MSRMQFSSFYLWNQSFSWVKAAFYDAIFMSRLAESPHSLRALFARNTFWLVFSYANYPINMYFLNYALIWYSKRNEACESFQHIITLTGVYSKLCRKITNFLLTFLFIDQFWSIKNHFVEHYVRKIFIVWNFQNNTSKIIFWGGFA